MKSLEIPRKKERKQEKRKYREKKNQENQTTLLDKQNENFCTRKQSQQRISQAKKFEQKRKKYIRIFLTA